MRPQLPRCLTHRPSSEVHLKLSLTLDTNCIVDVDENRRSADYVRSLADENKGGIADVAVVAISASEVQPGKRLLTNFSDFESRLADLNLGHSGILLPMAYLDVTFFDKCLFAGDDEIALEHAIHEILFPGFPFDTAKILGDEKALRSWRNKKCDVQAFWAHLHGKRDIFVTSDDNFLNSKKPRLEALGSKSTKIMRPNEAAEYVLRVSGTGAN